MDKREKETFLSSVNFLILKSEICHLVLPRTVNQSYDLLIDLITF